MSNKSKVIRCTLCKNVISPVEKIHDIVYGDEKRGFLCDNCYKDLQQYFIEKFENMMDALYQAGFYSEDYDENYDSFQEDINNQKLFNSNFSSKTAHSITTKNNKKKSDKINPKQIFNNVTKAIVGQDEAIKEIITTIIRNNTTSNPQFKSNIFLIGESGNGKTESIKQIANQLDIPFVIEDASKYTQEGYVGVSVEQAVVNLINVAGTDLVKASRGIIVFDEMDKKTDSGNRESGVATTSVQESLLKLVEGSTVMTTVGLFDTSLVTFIFIGACENVYLAREKRLGKKEIGFKTSYENKNHNEVLLNKSKNPHFLPDDLIKAGFKTELVGRIDKIIEFRSMTEEIAVRILLESTNSIFKFYIKELANLGVNVKIENEIKVINHIAKRAVKLKMGARGLRQIVVDMFSNIYSEILLKDIKLNEKYECIITEDTVYNNKKFKLCKKEVKI